MKRDHLDLIVLSLVEALLMRRTFLNLEQHALKSRDSAVLVFKLQSGLLLRFVLLNSNVVALNLLLQVLRVEVLDGVDHVLLDILQLVDRIYLRDWRDVHVVLNRVRMLELIIEHACLGLHLQDLHFKLFDAHFYEEYVRLLHGLLEL